MQAQPSANSASSNANQYAQSETSANTPSVPASAAASSSNPSLYAGASSGSAPAAAPTGPNMHQLYNSGMYQHQHHAHHDLYAAGGAVKCRISFLVLFALV